MNIAVLSDSHDQWKHLEWAIDIANKEQCGYLLFAGDLISPGMLREFEKFKGVCHFVKGNNEGEIVKLTRKIDEKKDWNFHNNIFDSEIEGRSIFMNHYPKISQIAAQTGSYNICIYGHDHKFNQETVKETLLLNPGELMGRWGDPTMAVVNLENLIVTKHTYET